MKHRRHTHSRLPLRITAGVVSVVLAATGLQWSAFAVENENGVEINFAAALQDSLYFYDANKCGDGITGGNLEWRGDCHLDDAEVPLITMGDDYIGTNMSEEFIEEYRDILDPDGDGTVDLTGGWHDAGDCVKFGLPGSYAASTMGWGYYEFRDAYEELDLTWHIEDELRWINDYYLQATFMDEDGNVIAYCYQVGEGNIDHNWWLTPELQSMEALTDYARPAYFATEETPASDQCAGAAASLAVNYLNFKDTDEDYAQECLDTAIALYEFAVETHTESDDDDMTVTSLGYDGGFYTSSYDYDELAWAAVWLYECTEDWDYIEDIVAVDETTTTDTGAHPYTGYLKRIIEDTGNCWQNIWVHCWDTVWGGVFAKLAPITNTARDWYIFRWNLEYWSGSTEEDAEDADYEVACTTHKYFGADDTLWDLIIDPEDIVDLPETDGAFLTKTPAGFAMLNNYGSCRYNCSFQLCALVYAKETGDFTFADWAEGQMEYILGDNPMGYSYLVGYSDSYASHPHHRASHGSTTLNMDDPEDQVHILWGALVGGPDEDDYHNDVTSDYIYNEVAVDYNAACTGALAGLYWYYGREQGDEILEDFPPSEWDYKDEIIEFCVSARCVQETDARSQIEVTFSNNTILPPRYVDDVTVRYYFDISELIEAGQSIDDITIEVYYDEESANTDGESSATISDPIPYGDSGTTYYVEISWQDCIFYGDRVFHFALIAAMDDNYTTNWDASNDYSREGLPEPDEEDPELTELITAYVDGELVWGIEPDGAETEETEEATETTSLEEDTEGEASDTSSDTDSDTEAEEDSDETSEILYGDVTLNGDVGADDAVLLARFLMGSASLSDVAMTYGDCDVNDLLDATDWMLLKQFLLEDLEALPVTS